MPLKKSRINRDCFIGGILQPSSNRIGARGLKRKLSPDACGRETPARPTRKTLCLFFISPAEFLLQLKRVFSGGGDSTFANYSIQDRDNPVLSRWPQIRL